MDRFSQPMPWESDDDLSDDDRYEREQEIGDMKCQRDRDDEVLND